MDESVPTGGGRRFAFEPVFALRTGRLIGWEVIPAARRDRPETVAKLADRGLRELVEFDFATAVAAVTAGLDEDPAAVLHVNLLADSVALMPRQVSALSGLLDRLRRPMSQIVLEVNPAQRAAPAPALLDGVKYLRAEGFRIALDHAESGFGLAVIDAAAAQFVKVGGWLARSEAKGRASTVVTGLASVAGGSGAELVGTDLRSEQELRTFSRWGVDHAQGPVLANRRRRPKVSELPADLQVASLAGVAEAMSLSGKLEPEGRAGRIADLAHAPVTLPVAAPAEQARELLAERRDARGIVLLEIDESPVGYLDRNRFFVALAGPYGHALYAERGVGKLAQPPRILHTDATVADALEHQRSTPDEHRLDDFVLVDARNRCTGVVSVADLLSSLAGSS